MDMADQSYTYNDDQLTEGLDFEFFDYQFSDFDVSNENGLAESYDRGQEPGSQAEKLLPSPASIPLCGASLSTPRMNSTDSTIKIGKRTFEECLFEFETSCPADLNSKRRKVFSSERRNKVRQVRKVGACVRCRIMKISVNPSSEAVTRHC